MRTIAFFARTAKSKQRKGLLKALFLFESRTVVAIFLENFATGGAQSTNSNTGELAVGKQADLLVLDEKQTSLFANKNEHLLDSVIFARQKNTVKDVMVNGCWVVQNGKHAEEQNSVDSFSTLLERLST